MDIDEARRKFKEIRATTIQDAHRACRSVPKDTFRLRFDRDAKVAFQEFWDCMMNSLDDMELMTPAEVWVDAARHVRHTWSMMR